MDLDKYTVEDIKSIIGKLDHIVFIQNHFVLCEQQKASGSPRQYSSDDYFAEMFPAVAQAQHIINQINNK